MTKPTQNNKQHHRPQHNNNNPYNKLNLNKFHQIDSSKHKTSESKILHKKKRDLERLIRHKKQKNEVIQEDKVKQLEQMTDKLSTNHSNFQKNMRKQFFIKQKYKQIMEIQMRKIKKRASYLEVQLAKNIEEKLDVSKIKEELQQYEKKKRYIKFFPKNLKYVSLFPSSKPLEEGAIQFQAKVMNDIEEKHQKQVQRKNKYVSENQIDPKEKQMKQKQPIKKTMSKDPKKKQGDDFFILSEEEEQQMIEQEQEQ